MNPVAANNPRRFNRLEGMALTALLQSLPTFAIAAMLLQLTNSSQLISHGGGAVAFVVMASLFHALLISAIGPSKILKDRYEPLFFESGLSFSQKVRQWLARPVTSVKLLIIMMMLSLLGVAVLSLR